MTKLGMEVEAVRSLAARLDGQTHALEQVIGRVDGLVRRAASEWHGPESTRFANEWFHRYRPALQRARDSVAGLAEAARNNANEQAGVSGAPGAGPNDGGAAGHRHDAAPRTDGRQSRPLLGPAGWLGVTAVGATAPQLLAAYAGGTAIGSVEDRLNAELGGSGNVLGDAADHIPVVGHALTFSADGARMINDVRAGDYGELMSHGGATALDAASLIPVVGAAKLGHDIGTTIASVPAIKHAMDSSNDEIIRWAQVHTHGDIAHRYDGLRGVGNYAHDFAGTVWGGIFGR